jgi:hypothetical protein
MQRVSLQFISTALLNCNGAKWLNVSITETAQLPLPLLGKRLLILCHYNAAVAVGLESLHSVAAANGEGYKVETVIVDMLDTGCIAWPPYMNAQTKEWETI